MDAGLVANTAAEDFTLIALFVRADIVVRMVMLLLVVASFWSWAISIDKWIALSATRTRARLLEECIQEGVFDDDMFHDAEDHPAAVMARVLAAGAHVMQHDTNRETVGERAKSAMQVAAARETTRMEQGLSTLAIVGSTAPFIGLFGTVWGIMNSFRAIAIARETNLAVVAPGIAEALFATALGLAAAIPAVVFYNKLSTDIDQLVTRMDLFAEDFIAYSTRRSGIGEDGDWK